MMAKGLNGTELPEQVYFAIFMVGGLGQAQHFWQIKGFNDRRHSVDMWYNLVASTPTSKSSTAVSKMSRLSLFHRKRSAAEVPRLDTPSIHDRAYCKDWYCVNPPCVEASATRSRQRLHGSTANHKNNAFYNSLSAGPPMAPLSREDHQRLLSDPIALPMIWFAAAESEIMSREIVEDINKIKKNTEVLTALIGEIKDNELPPNGLIEDWIPPGGYYNGLRRCTSTGNPRGEWDF